MAEPTLCTILSWSSTIVWSGKVPILTFYPYFRISSIRFIRGLNPFFLV